MLIEFLVKRPIAVIMSFLALVLFGIVSLNIMPVSLMPEIDIRVLNVQIDEEYYTSEELDKLIVKPIRNKLLHVSKLEDIKSKTEDGKSTITLSFDFNANIDYAFIEVNEKIDQIISSLPIGIKRPKVIKSNPTDIPLFYVNIPYPSKTDNKLEFSNFIENVVQKRLEQIPSVALVDITGNISPEISIIPDLNKMFNLGISHSEIKETIENNNSQLGNFKIKEGHYEYNIIFEPSITNVKEIRNLYINSGSSNIQLKDISTISLISKKEKGYFFSNKNQAISLAIIGKSDIKVKDLKNDVTMFLSHLEKENPAISYSLSQDQTELLRYSIESLQNSLILGGLLALFIMFLFVGDIRTSLIIGIVIPVSLVMSFFLLYSLNISINIISLSGLIISIGLIIDNSIIVIDNISQFRGKGLNLIDACAKGTYEIIKPLLSSLLTTCSVFIPLVYLSGISGVLFYDQAMAIIIGLSCSYIVSIVLLPTLFKLFKIENRKNRGVFFSKSYMNSFNLLFKYKKLTFVLFFLMFAISISGFFFLEKEKFPNIQYDDFYVNIDWNENISIEENVIRTKQLISYVEGLNVENINSYVGQKRFLINNNDQEENQLQIYVKVKSRFDTDNMKNKIVEFLDINYPQSTSIVQNSENLFEKIFVNTESELYLKIIENDLTDLNLLKTNLKENFKNLKIHTPKEKEVVEIKMRPDNLMIYQVNQKDLLEKLEYLFGSNQISQLKSTNSYLPIVIEGKMLDSYEVLNKAYVVNKNKAKIPIKDLISIESNKVNKYKFADSNINFFPIELETETPVKLINYVNSNIKDSNIIIDGRYFDDITLIKELTIIIVIVIILLYFILAAQFESLIQPLIILLEIPVSLGGSFIFLYVFNISLNIMSLIGFIIMLGIVVNDSILKIDAINQLVKIEKIPIMNAIHEAGLKRLNAILMTSLTTIIAMIPILLYNGISADLQKPLAISVIGGMIIGTFASLYFVPIIYWMLMKNKKI